MVRNDMFYIHYPYIPETETNTNSAQVLSSTTRKSSLMNQFYKLSTFSVSMYVLLLDRKATSVSYKVSLIPCRIVNRVF